MGNENPYERLLNPGDSMEAATHSIYISTAFWELCEEIKGVGAHIRICLQGNLSFRHLVSFFDLRLGEHSDYLLRDTKRFLKQFGGTKPFEQVAILGFNLGLGW